MHQNMCSTFLTLGRERLVRDIRIKKSAVGPAGTSLMCFVAPFAKLNYKQKMRHKYYMQYF